MGDTSLAIANRFELARLGQSGREVRQPRKAFFQKGLLNQVQKFDDKKFDKYKSDERRKKLRRLQHQVTQPIP